MHLLWSNPKFTKFVIIFYKDILSLWLFVTVEYLV